MYLHDFCTKLDEAKKLFKDNEIEIDMEDTALTIKGEGKNLDWLEVQIWFAEP